jgi:hypothetical protein
MTLGKSPPGRFAPHIHVLYREVPFILNITACFEKMQSLT